MLRDILEESWTYQELKADARQEVEQEIKKNEHQLELARLRTAFSDIVQKRFPKLARLTKTLGSGINDPDILLNLIISISTADTLEEATEILIAMGEREG